MILFKNSIYSETLEPIDRIDRVDLTERADCPDFTDRMSSSGKEGLDDWDFDAFQ